MEHFRRLVFTLNVFMALSLSNMAWANGPPIQGESGFVTGLNGAAFRSFVKIVRKSGAKGEVNVIAVPLIVPYELVDNKLILGIGLPLLFKKVRMKSGTERSAGFGIGDLFFFAKFNMFQKDKHQETLRIAGKFGITFPTGRDDTSDSFGPLPPSLQRGTGSVNPSIMLILTKLWRRFGLSVDAGYTALTEANNIDRGDEVRYDLATSFRILPWVFGVYPAHQINLMLEFNGTWKKKTRSIGTNGNLNPDPNSGGNVLFISPGLQYMYSTVIIEASIQLPIRGATALNGVQMKPDWTLLFGIRWLLF